MPGEARTPGEKDGGAENQSEGGSQVQVEVKQKKDKEPTSGRHEASLTPILPPVPTINSLAGSKLPVELLRQIIHEVKDKATLATCMRVSSALNHLVAPALYKSIHIRTEDHHDHHPFVIPTPRELANTRLSAPKRELLKLVDMVTVDHHSRQDCEAAIGELPLEPLVKPWSPKYTGSCLRVNLGEREDGCRGYCFHGSGSFSPPMRCGMFKLFGGKTLVLFDVGGATPFNGCPPRPSTVETIVAVIRSSIPMALDKEFYPTKKPLKSVVYILPPEWDLYLNDFAQALVRAVASKIASSYTIVQLGGLRIPLFRAIISRHLAVPNHWKRPEYLDKAQLQNALDAVSVITMKELTSTHDVRGMFTDKEVDRWLMMDAEEVA